MLLFWLIITVVGAGMLVFFWPQLRKNSWVKAFLKGWKKITKWLRRKFMRVESRAELEAALTHAKSLSDHERQLLFAALNFAKNRPEKVMTPAAQLVTVKPDEKLTPTVLNELYATGQQIFFVSDRGLGETVGVIYLAEIADIAHGAKTISKVMHPRPLMLPAETPILEILDIFLHQDQKIVFLEKAQAVVGTLELHSLLSSLFAEGKK